jgi:hypothetical protein
MTGELTVVTKTVVVVAVENAESVPDSGTSVMWIEI